VCRENCLIQLKQRFVLYSFCHFKDLIIWYIQLDTHLM